jgi:hypothetical protein
MRPLSRLAVAELAQSSGTSFWRGRLCRAMTRAMIWLSRRRFSGGREAQSCGSGTSWVLVAWVARSGTGGGARCRVCTYDISWLVVEPTLTPLGQL